MQPGDKTGAAASGKHLFHHGAGPAAIEYSGRQAGVTGRERRRAPTSARVIGWVDGARTTIIAAITAIVIVSLSALRRFFVRRLLFLGWP